MKQFKQAVSLFTIFTLLFFCTSCGNTDIPAQSSMQSSAVTDAPAAASEESSPAAVSTEESSPAAVSTEESLPAAVPTEENTSDISETGPVEQDAGGGMVLNDGTPWVDYSLRENIALAEERPSPKDDFYLYADYDWLRSAEIAPGNSLTSAFDDMNKQTTEMCIDVLTDDSLEGKEVSLAQYLYNAFLDWDSRNALGIEPLQKIVDEITAVSDLDGLTQYLCSSALNADSLFRFDSLPGLNDPGTYIVYIYPIWFTLNDAAEYRERTEQGDRMEAAWRNALLEMLPKLGYTEAEAAEMTDRVFALESEMALSAMTEAEEMSPDYSLLINNEMTRSEAQTLCSAFPWLTILDAWGFDDVQRYIVTQPAFMKQMDAVYREDRLEDLKSFLITRSVMYCMSQLDRDSYEIDNERINAMYGREGTVSDEEDACSNVRYYLPTAIDRAFLSKYDATKMKQDITDLCEEAVAYYRRMLGEEEWLTAETREKAIKKLDSMKINAVFPEKWRDLSGLSFEGSGVFDCLEAIRRDNIDFLASLADQPVDSDLWYFGNGDSSVMNDILTDNAGYEPTSNAIFIMRGILMEPIYREDMSEEELYGSIGFAIAHEISHAFDPVGAQYDAEGRLNNWWSEADSTAFSARTDRLIAYYDEMVAFGGYHVQGQNIQTEACADMAGMKCMLGLLEQKEDADYKTFFENFALVWRTLISEEVEYYYLMYDPHPLSFLRINATVQQFPQFHETYGVTEGDRMFLAPDDRVLVW